MVTVGQFPSSRPTDSRSGGHNDMEQKGARRDIRQMADSYINSPISSVARAPPRRALFKEVQGHMSSKTKQSQVHRNNICWNNYSPSP